jgi:hypothetical protein
VTTDHPPVVISGGYAYRFLEPGDEAQVLELLRGSLDWDDADVTDWRWKHADRPGFSAEDVVVALDTAGEIVACFHSAIVSLHLGDGLVTRVSLDGDFVVHQDHRGSNIPTPALQLNDERFLREQVTLRGGFTTEELNRRFYNKRYGYVFVPPSSTNFKRPLTVQALRPAVDKLGVRYLQGRALSARLATSPLRVNCRISGLAVCHVELRTDGFVLYEGPTTTAQLSLTVPYRVIAARAVSLPRYARNTLSDLVLGRIRVAGLWKHRRRVAGLAAAVVRDRLRRG